MARLEDLTKGALVSGVLADRAVKVIDVAWHGSNAVTLTFTDESTGKPGQELLYRDNEPRLSVKQSGRAWSMDADGSLFRLVSEAKRISLAYLFDPFLAVQTSNLDPLPHQIEAVYSKMLPRQPLRYLLADDPGAGKTIMAGLFCKELMIRGDVERCLIIAPGSLVEQWQDELWQKFGLSFEILTRELIESARSGNPFGEKPLLIARLDHLSRNEELQGKLQAVDWDLVVVDEAHKMSAHYMGGEVKATKRYRLGQLAGSVTRHLLLMTATPHAGIEEDFHLFLALLDADRFEGKPRGAAHTLDTSDLMRRLVKEKLLKFDGTPLFPERRSYTAIFPLSDGEALLYKRVTEYVQGEMNRAERLKAEGEGRRGRSSASPSRSSSGAWPPLPKPSTSRSRVGGDASRTASRTSASASGASSWRLSSAPRRSLTSFAVPKMTSMSTTCPRESSRSSRRNSSTRHRPLAQSPSSSTRSPHWLSSRSWLATRARQAPTANGRSSRTCSSTLPRCSMPTGSAGSSSSSASTETPSTTSLTSSVPCSAGRRL